MPLQAALAARTGGIESYGALQSLRRGTSCLWAGAWVSCAARDTSCLPCCVLCRVPRLLTGAGYRCRVLTGRDISEPSPVSKDHNRPRGSAATERARGEAPRRRGPAGAEVGTCRCVRPQIRGQFINTKKKCLKKSNINTTNEFADGRALVPRICGRTRPSHPVICLYHQKDISLELSITH